MARQALDLADQTPSHEITNLSRQIRLAVGDLHHVNRGHGWLRLLLLVAIVLSGAWMYWHALHWAAAVIGLVLVGVAESGLLIATHEALHGTLLALPRWEGMLSCLIAWPMAFPIQTYKIIHQLHHRWNNVECRDPERIETCAHPWLKLAVVAGGLGLIFKTVEQAWKLRQTEPRLARRLINDATGIALLHGVLLGLAIHQGCLLKYVVSWIVVERIVGVIMQSRALVEHWGLWQPQRTFLLSQLYGCRNVEASGWLNTIMGGLPHHSVHHAFPGIPCNQMAEATMRIKALLNAYNMPPLPQHSSYLVALRQLR